jgi:hypothetical protein
MRDLPPLNALAAFEIVARTGSVRCAAVRTTGHFGAKVRPWTLQPSLTLKDNAFSSLIDQDPSFELRPEDTHERTILRLSTKARLRHRYGLKHRERQTVQLDVGRRRPEDGLLTQSKRLVRLPSTRSTIARAALSTSVPGPEYGAYPDAR